MKNRHALNFVLAATLLSMTVLTVHIPFVRAIEWSSENPLTTDPNQDRSPSIMQAENGTIWVVWASNRMGFLNYELFYKNSSDYGSNWSPDTRLTQYPSSDTSPSIMQASNGTIWVVWSSDRTENYELFYKNSSDYGSNWSPDIQLTIDPNWDRTPSIMQAGDGLIWVVWSSNRNGNYELFYKTYDGSAWSSYTQLTTDPGLDRSPSIMQAGDETIWVVWSSYRTENYELFYKNSSDYGSNWSPDTQLTFDPDFDTRPSIAQARDGTIWVVWQSDRSPGPAQNELYYKTYDGSAWSSVTQLTSDPADDVASSIAQIDDRKIWVVWSANRDEDFDIYYKTTVVIPGDVNGDGIVDITDLALVGEAYGKVEGDPDYNPAADLNWDDIVDIYDLAEIGKNYG